jgi:hypothetical protein
VGPWLHHASAGRRSGGFEVGPALSSPYDTQRFRLSCEGRGLRVKLDVVGQVAIFDRQDRLLAMFAARGELLAGWGPSGARFGPPDLIGGPPTPRALEALGRALKAAEEGGS